MISELEATDLFCGAGGSSIGAEQAGIRLRLGLNHWKRAIETHATNFPHADHDCTDVQACDPRYYPRTPILLASPECFPAGTLILAKRGLIPIEAIRVGDEVLTHRNRWRSVQTVTQSVKDTIIVRGEGHYGLELTANHPVLARKYEWKWRQRRILYDPAWIPACQLQRGMYWASPVIDEIPSLAIPDVGGRGVIFCEAFWWMVGKWLADGVVAEKAGDTRHIRISCSFAEVDEVYRRVNFCQPTQFHAAKGEYHWSREVRDHQILLVTSHNGLGTWLTEQFGKHAHGKMLPSWVLTMPKAWRQALLDGYLFGDGTYDATRREYRFATVSRPLAVGMRLLALSLGHACKLRLRPGGTIEAIYDKTFVRKPQYWGSFIAEPCDQTAIRDGDHYWFRVREVQPGQEAQTVYNLAVEEDESYIADGMVVHNCTNHTVAKGVKRFRQFDLWNEYKLDPAAVRSRCTMWDVVRFAEVHRYELCIIENVVEARKWELWDSWIHAMDALGYRHQEVYLNSMHIHPIPQSRDRLYIIFTKKGNPQPDLDIRPSAYCVKCGKNVESVQSWKNPTFHWGRYKQQYVYCCPHCASIVTPYYYCAANIIDWTIPAPRIGDRKRPLEEKTRNRIRIGLEKYANQALLVGMYGPEGQRHAFGVDTIPAPTMTGSRTWGVAMPPSYLIDTAFAYGDDRSMLLTSASPTQTGQQSLALISPPNFFASLTHSDDRFTSETEPLPTIMPQANPALVASPAYIVMLRGNNAPTGLEEALATFCGSGTHHGLVVSPFLASYYGTDNTSQLDAAVPTVPGHARHALVMPNPSFLLSYYTRMSAMSGLAEEVPTIPGMAVHYLAQPGELPEVDDCGFRMLTSGEIKAAMDFPLDYIITGNEREKVKQCGNAVTCSVMTELVRRGLATFA